jgi:hypothetical protein
VTDSASPASNTPNTAPPALVPEAARAGSPAGRVPAQEAAGGGGKSTVAAHGHLLEFSPETFWAVVFRRTRYAVAVAISAAVFCTLGWQFASPAPQLGGISLIAWESHGWIGGVVLVLLLLAMTAVCSLLVHPDSPHMGLFCALLGMAGLSIRGGTIHNLIEYAQRPFLVPQLPAITYAKLADLLAIECMEWAVMVLIAEVFARLLHDRFLTNTHWITRSGPTLEGNGVPQVGTAMGVSLTVSRAMRTSNLKRRIATPVVMVYSGAIAMLLLYVLMQSQAKGQVLMACFVAFFVSTMCGYLIFPRIPIAALMLTVPLVAEAGYLYGRNMVPMYPGHASFFAMRALPIDYFTAGVPGAILGFYSAFRWSMHSHEP